MDKLVYKLIPVEGCRVGLDELACANTDIHGHLQAYKEKITKYYNDRLWDKYKKFANDFELVFTSSSSYPNVSSYNSISRSFFKLWEIIHDFHGDMTAVLKKNTVNALFLAEGPGGFVEAFTKYRGGNIDDKYYGMTLISSNRTVPSWKLPKHMLSNQVNLMYGADGTGDLYNIKNIDYLSDNIGSASCDFITADGGFDFSVAFNKQEELSVVLICAEVYTALCMQKEGGVFVLKVFDLCSEVTIRVLHILHKSYDAVYITKPHSSRPANSEKYVVCIGFKGVDEMDEMNNLRKCIERKNTRYLTNMTKAPPEFYSSVLYFNSQYIMRQIFNIQKTIVCIDNIVNNKKQSLPGTIRLQLEHAIRWCAKYNIKISIDSLKKYKEYLTTSKSIC